MHHTDNVAIDRFAKGKLLDFNLDGCNYYTTKTGIRKKKHLNKKAITINENEYMSAWERYDFIFN